MSRKDKHYNELKKIIDDFRKEVLGGSGDDGIADDLEKANLESDQEERTSIQDKDE